MRCYATSTPLIPAISLLILLLHHHPHHHQLFTCFHQFSPPLTPILLAKKTERPIYLSTSLSITNIEPWSDIRTWEVINLTRKKAAESEAEAAKNWRRNKISLSGKRCGTRWRANTFSISSIVLVVVSLSGRLEWWQKRWARTRNEVELVYTIYGNEHFSFTCKRLSRIFLSAFGFYEHF